MNINNLKKSRILILEYLKRAAYDKDCSLGLHTTEQKKTADLICENGLYEMGGRTLEGTLKFRGKISEVLEEDFEFFFPYTNYTVVVAIPSQFEASRIDDNLGGDISLCEFSKLFSYIDENDKKDIFPEFFDGLQIRVPPELVVGYYDKDYNFYDNPKSIFSTKEFVDLGNSLKTRFLEVYELERLMKGLD